MVLINNENLKRPRERKMYKIQSASIALAAIVIFFQACSTGLPKRITSEKAFYGVGSASALNNFSLQRTASDDRARNDLAKVFEFYTKSLTKDYMASITAEDLRTMADEQNIEAVLKTVTSATLTGVQIVDHWEHPYRNELFSLARLDLKRFKQNLDQYKILSEAVRKAVKKRADKLHEELELEVLKKEGLI